MKTQFWKFQMVICGLASLLVTGSAFGRGSGETPFKYEGGTEMIEQGCAGDLEVLPEALVFKCPAGSIEMPFSAITLLQYRPDISPRVRKMKINWKVRPGRGGGSHNKYLIVLFQDAKKATHIAVLKVTPVEMRPYLAEIELKSGKRVHVMGHEDYR
jgi:hypothetical protein